MQLLVVTVVSTGKWLHRFLWWFQQANGCTCTGFCSGFSRQMVVQVFVVVQQANGCTGFYGGFSWQLAVTFVWWFHLANGCSYS